MNGMLTRSILVMVMTMGVAIPATVRAQTSPPVQKAQEAAKQAADELAAAEAAATAAKAVADETVGAATAAEQTLATAKAANEKAAAIVSKAVGDSAEVAKQSAAKSVEAVKAAEAALAAAKGLTEKAVAAHAAAQKARTDKAAAADRATRKVLAERAFAAAMAVRAARGAHAEAQNQLSQKADVANKAAAALTTAEQTAAKASGALAAAEKLLTERAALAKSESDKASAAAPDASDKAALTDAAAKAEAQRAEAQQLVAQTTAESQSAAEKVAAAKAELDKAAAEKAAAEQAVSQQFEMIRQATDTAAVVEAEVLGGLKSLTSSQWDRDKARHLLWRAGFGGTPEQVERLAAIGLHAAVEEMVNYHRQPACDVAFTPRLPERSRGYENLLEPNEREQLNNERTNRERAQQDQMRHWWLRRMAESPRPLEEKLTLFWHDHFATGYEDKLYQTHILYQQNEMFRQFADKYDALLRGIIHDPAMIIYLDNHTNVKGQGNENLGREVLELFSLGRDQGYTEQDLRELSRALTGYTFAGNVNQFRFNAGQHDGDPKTILGRTGNFGGDEAIDVILQHPATARYIAKKLFEYFAYEGPSQEVVDRLAHVLRDNHYELAPMLTNLFLSEEFYSDASRGRHIKSPVELMIGTIRALKITNVNWGHVDWEIQNMGMTLFQPPNVGGWEEGRTWISANRIMLRYNGVANLVERPEVDVAALLEGKAQTPEQIVDHLAAMCLAIPLRPEQRQELIDFLGPIPPADQWAAKRNEINARLRALLVLMMSIPEYQVS